MARTLHYCVKPDTSLVSLQTVREDILFVGLVVTHLIAGHAAYDPSLRTNTTLIHKQKLITHRRENVDAE